MTGIHTSNTGVSSSTEGTTNDWDTYVKHRSIFEYRGYNQWLGYIRQTQEYLRVQRVQPMTGIHSSNTGTRRCSCVWRMYPSHWLYPLYSKILLCLTYVSQSLVVPSVLEDAPVFDECIPVIGCTLCTRRYSCVWRMYPSHWLYPLYSKMLLCLTYVSQTLVVPSALEDAPVFDDSHWLYPLHSKILLCLTYVSQSLVVPSVLEDTPVFDVCIPVIGCTLCTRRYSCVWRMYPRHWLYPLSIFEYRGYNQWLGYIRQTQEYLRVQRVQPMTVVKHRSILEYRGYNQWLGYIRQTQEYLRVQRVQPMTGIHTSNTGASSSTEGTTNDWDTYVKHRSIFEYRGYNQWLGYIRQTQEHLRVQRVQPMTGIHTSNTGAS